MSTQIDRKFHPLASAWLLAAALLAGCASMDEDECRSADWRLVGYEDGAAGRSAAHVGEHREACADYRISPDMEAYREGREAGLREYCRAPNGFRLGQAGGSYGGVCPTDLEAEFRDAYDAGYRVYTARSRVRSTEKRIRSKERELASIKKRYSSMTNEMISDGTTTARRAELLVETTQSAQRQGELEAEVLSLERELVEQRRQLAEIESEARAW
ncbi:MAG: DUF2799 domain-containing protein [Gammaproteobacteria bacterium]|nr:DUF2799 domain-containing protein [Gammaproteobacteria bacterium]